MKVPQVHIGSCTCSDVRKEFQIISDDESNGRVKARDIENVGDLPAIWSDNKN
jgi:hypothetical protein